MDDARREACRRGGLARAAQPSFREHQRAAGRARGNQLTREELSALGKRGYRATIARHGIDFAYEKAHEYRLNNPSPHETRVAEILDRLGLRYVPQFRILPDRLFEADFYLADYALLIEVDGEPHTLPFAAEKEAVARAAKLAAITEHTTFRVLVLDWRELDQAEAQIVAAVQGLAVVVPAPLADVYDDADLLDTW